MIDRRLLAISEMVIKGEPAADIGADHAALSLYMIEHGIVPKVVASEYNEGPLNRAWQAVKNSPFQEKIELRKGNGLEVLEPEEVSTVIIAGMGGDTIVGMLASDREKAGSFGYYLFQPMSKPDVLRNELSISGWPILAERLVQDQRRYYAIIASCPGSTPYKLTRLEMDVGPKILKDDNKLNQTYLRYWLQKYYAVYRSLSKKDKQENNTILEQYKKRIDELEGILNASKG